MRFFPLLKKKCNVGVFLTVTCRLLHPLSATPTPSVVNVVAIRVLFDLYICAQCDNTLHQMELVMNTWGGGGGGEWQY